MNVLRKAYDILKDEGRTEATLYNPDTGAYCPVGALGSALGLKVAHAWGVTSSENATYSIVANSVEGKFLADFLVEKGYYVPEFDQEFYDDDLPHEPDAVIYEWNDSSTEQTVLRVMAEAAQVYESQLDNESQL